jgi:hypothetical protein
MEGKLEAGMVFMLINLDEPPFVSKNYDRIVACKILLVSNGNLVRFACRAGEIQSVKNEINP